MTLRRLTVLIMVGATMAAAFTVKFAAAGAIGSGVQMPPIAVWTALAWFFTLSFVGRLLLGVLAGFALDAAGLPPFGGAIILLMLLAGAAEGILRVIAHRESRLARIAAWLLLGLSAVIFAPPARIAASYLLALF